jgi:phosphoglycerate dehydrogenase-like enzyme
MARYNVLYLCPLGKQHQTWRLAAAPADFDVVMRRSTETSREEVVALARQADALITERAGEVDRRLIEAAPRLRIIQRIGSLYHDIDLDAAREFHVPVCVRPIRGTIAVAENLVLQMLAVLRRAMPLQKVLHAPPEAFAPCGSRRTSEDVFAFNWSQQTRIGLIHGKTIGILGFGEIGVELARRLQPWGCQVLYAKRHPLPRQVEEELRIAHRDAEALLRESDIVVCLLPYFQETDLWLNAQRIAMMKPGAWLVEAGSGSVVDEHAVADAVRSGHLAGASFDTYEWEPIRPDNPLLALADGDPEANIFLLPHIGSCSDGANHEYADFYSNVRRALDGQPLEGRIA